MRILDRVGWEHVGQRIGGHVSLAFLANRPDAVTQNFDTNVGHRAFPRCIQRRRCCPFYIRDMRVFRKRIVRAFRVYFVSHQGASPMDAVQLVALLNAVPLIGPYAVWLPVLVLACAAVDALVPQPAAGSPWAPVRRVVSWVALNVSNARNALPAGAPSAAAALAQVIETVVEAHNAKPPIVPVALLALALAGLSACTTDGTLTPTAAARAALYCGINISSGPLIVALVSAADPAAAAVAVTTKQAVDAACAMAGGIPVSPPGVGVVAPKVAVPGMVDTVG